MSKTAVLLLAALGFAQGVFHRTPAQVFLQQVAPQYAFSNPGSFGSLQFRLPVNGFGNGASTFYQAQGTNGRTSFNNPPPPLGAATDPATQTCGLAPPVCQNSRYRSIDGSCNNLQRPTWGVPQMPYGRLLPYNYGDGISSFPRSVSGRELPNPREISIKLFPDRQLMDPIWNLNTMQWGQIVTHDMSLTAGVTQSRKDVWYNKETVTCCDDNGQLTPDAASNPVCAPILIPPHDPVHAPLGTQCQNFVRTGSSRDRGCTAPNAPAQPLSVVTAWMDLSLVYGSSQQQADAIRAFIGGRLTSVLRGGQEWPPQDPNVTQTCESAQSPNEPCYLTGDIRVNQNPQLTILQIILFREHNRLANILAKLNPHWNDEILYQEARRINIAEYQHINYYEYLPVLIGFGNMQDNSMNYPLEKGFVNDYNPNVDPSVLDEHATAAFRHFHSLIRGYLQLVSENRELLGAVRLSDWFNRPLILELGTSFNDLTRGMTVENMDYSDQFFTSEITQFLFKRNNTFGGDLRATDIQRGRDHGLASYVDTRAICSLPVPKTFEDMTDYISVENVKLLESLYDSPADVELVVAASLEKLVTDALVGPTFLCILTEQFFRTRVSDRYFYENGGDPATSFTLSQLQSIRHGTSMARLLCDNMKDVQFMQPLAFRLVGEGNKLVPCDSLWAVDLTLWQEKVGDYKK